VKRAGGQGVGFSKTGKQNKGWEEGGLTIDRIASFSDAVFAVAITLLVLSLDVPQIPEEFVSERIGSEVAALWPKFASFALSFVIVGFFWIMHHSMFKYIKRHNREFLWLNLLFLMCIVLIPFSSDLVSEYGDTALGTMFYAANWGTASLVIAVMWYYASQGNRLVDDEFEPAAGRHASRSFFITSLVFFFSIPLALVNVGAAQMMWILLFPVHVLRNRFTGVRELE
jgi:uncharacterized membrane protein